MRTFHAATLVVAALSLGGCSGYDNAIGTTNTQSGNGAPPAVARAAFRPMFQVAQGIFPYPTDLYFNGSTDGTLRMPLLATLPNAATINQQDGFSTTSPITVRFSEPIDGSSLSPANVIVIRVTLDNSTKAPDPAGPLPPQVLKYGIDFTASVSTDIDSQGSVLVIEPVTPLVPSSGLLNAGYIVLLTNGIKNTAGVAAAPDNDYQTMLNGALADLLAGKHVPTCATVSDPTLNKLCQLTFAHVGVGALLRVVDPTTVVLSFSFSTQSIGDTLGALWATYQRTPVAPGTIVAQPAIVQGHQLTTHDLVAVLPGLADIWVGQVTVPYYLTAPSAANPLAAVTKFWTAASAPNPLLGLDPSSRALTRFNPLPLKTADLAIPLFIGKPNAQLCPRPMNGWPAIVFLPGLLLDRTYATTLMDGYVHGGCFVVVAFDLPLHGVTDTTSPFYQAGHERTFDLDLQNNTTGAAGPDGKIDLSGTNYINLTSLLTSRDNSRQAESDILWIGHVLPTLSLNAAHTPDIDGSNIQFACESTGCITGVAALSMPNTPYRTGVLSQVGGGVAYLLRDSASFKGRINAGLAQKGLRPGLTLYSNFFRDAQTAVDSSDPQNFIAAAVANRPLLIQQVIGGGTLADGSASLADLVIPNSSTERLLIAANFVRASMPGLTPLPAGHGAYVNFIYGFHGNIFGPNPAHPASLQTFEYPVSVEMQTEAVGFAVAHGQAVTLANPAVVQP